MSLEYILFPQSTVFQFQENSLCPQSAVYVLKVQFLAPENSLCPYGTVNVPRVKFMSSGSSLCQ